MEANDFDSLVIMLRQLKFKLNEFSHDTKIQ